MLYVCQFAVGVISKGRQVIHRIGQFIGQMCTMLEGINIK